MSLPMDDTFSLPVILAWLRANMRKIVLGGVVCALLAVPVSFFKAKTYESVATLLISPPTFKDRSRATTVKSDSKTESESIAEMMPRALPVEAYKAIALSPPLLNEVIEKIPLENTTITALKARLEVELVQMGSRGSQGIMYTQTLIFHAQAPRSPELAAKTAETWAEVFKEQMDAVAAKGIGETFTLLETLHNNTKKELEQADLALAEHRKTWNLDLIKAQVEAKQKQLTEFESDLKKTEVDLASGEMKLKAIEEELAKEPKKEVYFRAPSDDAYWIAGTQNGGKPKIEPDQGLRTEVSNPNYVETRTAEVTARGEVEGLKAKKEMILLKLDELKKEIDALTVTYSDKTVERDGLMRESQRLKDSYTVVSAEYEKGRMADRTQASDIVIAGKAVVPRQESGLSNPKLVLVAGFLGMMLTGGFLLLKHLSEMAPLTGAGAIKEQQHTDLTKPA